MNISAHIKRPSNVALAALAALAIVAIAWLGLRAVEERRLFAENVPQQEKVALWQKYIERYGAEAAYTFLVETQDTKHYTGIERHTLGHLFGEALYAEIGIDGFLLCDLRTAYGCLHEISARALTESGLSAAHEINDLCLQTFGELSFNCQHGIGHGLLVNTSYTKNDRDDALSVCAELPDNSFHSGCNSGVFMEYMLHSSLGEDSGVFPYRDDIAEPCRDLSTQLSGACSLRLPEWWMRTLLNISTSQENVRALGDMCVEVGNELDINDSLCFSGIGNSLVLENVYDPHEVIAICSAASNDADDRFWCKKTAAKHLLDGNTLEAALQICDSMEGVYRSQCEREAQERDTLNTTSRLP